MDCRQFAAEAERVETGAIRFGDDWPGVFIRGDNAFHFAMHLEAILKANAAAEPVSAAVLLGLVTDLRSCIMGPGHAAP